MSKLSRVGHGAQQRWRALSAPAPMRDFDDYDAYWDERGEIGQEFHRWKVATDRIPDSERVSVLDIGCGSGEFLEYLRQRRPRAKIVGADFSPAAVERTRSKGIEAHVIDLQVQDPPGVFDFVTSFETLEHIPDAETAARRLSRAVKRELIVSIPNVGYIDNRIRLALFGRFPNTNCVFHVKEHVRHWTVRDFTEWAPHCGLTVVGMEGQYAGTMAAAQRRFPGLFCAGMVYILKPIG